MSVEIFKRRTNHLQVHLGYDVSGDTFESEIRAGKDFTTPKIVDWTVTYLTDGTDGKLLLTIDDSLLMGPIPYKKGYWDLKRITGGEPIQVFADPVSVLISNPVTQ